MTAQVTLNHLQGRDQPASTAQAGQTPFVSLSPAQRKAALFLFWAYLAIVASLALFKQTTGAEKVIPALFLVASVRLIPLLFYRTDYGWFHPLIFGLLYWVFDLVRNLPNYAYGLDQNLGLPGYRIDQLAGLVAYGLILEALSQLAYLGGFFAGIFRWVPPVSFHPPQKLALKTAAVVVFSLAFFGYYMARQGGIAAHLLFLGQGRTNLINQGLLSGEWAVLVRLGAFACLIWLALDRKATTSLMFWVCAFISVIPLYLVAGSRSSVVYIIVVGLIIWMLREKKIEFFRVIVIGVTSVILIGVLGDLRASSWKGRIDWDVLLRSNPIAAFEDGFEEIRYRSGALNPLYPILARVPADVDLLYGQSYLKLLSLPIPRALWPDKPRTTGSVIGSTFFNRSDPIPPGAIAEAYWNFHLPGVILVFFAFGTFHAWLAGAFKRYAQQPAALILYAYTLFYLVPEVLSITGWIYAIGSIILLFVLLGVISLRPNLRT